MQIYRLFIDIPLSAGVHHILNDTHAHYVRNVIRLSPGDELEVFNGIDGLWRAKILHISKKTVEISCEMQLKPQSSAGTIDVYFAPLKNPRLEYVVQKMVEMGARTITPVKTQHTQMQHYNVERVKNYIIEGAEQCGILSLPILHSIVDFRQMLAHLPSSTTLVYCDEAAQVQNPLIALKNLPENMQIALLIGPEGGFSSEERDILRAHKQIMPIALGPRILRADTALVAAMAVLQAVQGDW